MANSLNLQHLYDSIGMFDLVLKNRLNFWFRAYESWQESTSHIIYISFTYELDFQEFRPNESTSSYLYACHFQPFCGVFFLSFFFSSRVFGLVEFQTKKNERRNKSDIIVWSFMSVLPVAHSLVTQEL